MFRIGPHNHELMHFWLTYPITAFGWPTQSLLYSAHTITIARLAHTITNQVGPRNHFSHWTHTTTTSRLAHTITNCCHVCLHLSVNYDRSLNLHCLLSAIDHPKLLLLFTPYLINLIRIIFQNTLFKYYQIYVFIVNSKSTFFRIIIKFKKKFISIFIVYICYLINITDISKPGLKKILNE